VQNKLEAFLPHVLKWIDQLLESSASNAKFVSSYGFLNLPRFFDKSLLDTARVVISERLPIPPLTSLGLEEFSEFEKMQFDGITYKDVYFVKPNCAYVEALHFHELVHVLQWRILGPEAFLLSYGQSLVNVGYFHTPFELMANKHAALFRSGITPYDVAGQVHSELIRLST
jgi:hypothetical protein